MSKFVFFVVPKMDIFFFYSQIQKPIHSHLFNVLKILPLLVWMPEIFQFHLFKLSCAKKEISRRNFVSKYFTNLSNSKRKIRTKRIHNIFKISKNSLRGFR